MPAAANTGRLSLRHDLVTLLIVAVAYAVTGRLSLWLAIPPGYATPIWAPAGLALAAVLIAGARVWPGIWLGSVLVNLWTAFDATTALAMLTSVAIPTSIGVGATLQALGGASLVRRFVGFPSALTRGDEIGTFLVLGGPISCVVSATVGTTVLVVSGQIPGAMAPISWGTWWAGDTLGVLIVLPLVLCWLGAPQPIWQRRRLAVALPLVGALALAVVVFAYTRAQEQERLTLLFERQATTAAERFRDSLDDYLDVLYGVESFYASSGGLSRQAFHTFVQRAFARHPGLQALSWDRRVPDAQREAYEEAIRQEGYPDFQITQQHAQGQLVRAAPRPEYVVVSYIEPYAGNARALGFDVASAPDRIDALQRARETGQPSAAGPLMLVQETSGHFGLLIFLPIYGHGLPRTTVEERRQSLEGYVTGVFRIDDMVDASLPGLEGEDLTLRIEDEAAPTVQHVLYDSRARGEPRLALDAQPREPATGMRWDTAVELAGRRWALRFAPTLAYLARRQSLQPWAVLGSGLVFTSLLGAFLLLMTGRANIIEQLVVERTAQLEAALQELAGFSYAIAHDLRAPLRAMNSFSQILLEDYAPQLDAEAQGYLQRVSRNALRMAQLIDDLLAFAQLSHEPLRKQLVAPADVVREILDELRPEYEHRQVEITLGDLPRCSADPALLKQVWVNLLSNALKFTRQRQVARIDVGCQDREGACVYFVRDNGVGFDMQYVDKLFGVFQRLHRLEEYEGTGVGLALTQRIVYRHGGRIWAEGAVDKGATFSFMLGA